jgi:uncharacterized FlaG/YvyC family protein
MILSTQERENLEEQLKIISTTLDFNSSVSLLYYNLTVDDFLAGASIRQIQSSLRFYEELELYDECHGIFMAIKYYKIIMRTFIDKNYEN